MLESSSMSAQRCGQVPFTPASTRRRVVWHAHRAAPSRSARPVAAQTAASLSMRQALVCSVVLQFPYENCLGARKANEQLVKICCSQGKHFIAIVSFSWKMHACSNGSTNPIIPMYVRIVV